MRLRDWPLFLKILSLFILVLGGFVVFISAYYLPFFRDTLLEEKKGGSQLMVDLAVSAAGAYLKSEKSGDLTTTEARQQALRTLDALTYGEGEYFFVMDLNGVILSHPDEGLRNRNMTGTKDTSGKAFFQEMVDGAKKDGSGTVDYMWPKPGETKPVHKITAYRVIPEWGWIVATGVWVEDVDRLASQLATRVWLSTGIGAAGMALVVFLFTFVITRPIQKFLKQSKTLVAGDLTVDIKTERRDETGQMIHAVGAVVGKLTGVIDRVIPVAVRIDDSIGVLKTAVDRTVAGTEKQADRAGQISAAAEEMTQTVSDLARTSSSSASLSREAMQTALTGRQYAEQASTGVGKVNEAAGILVERIEQMNRSAKEISEVVGLIRGIAEQTNLIALNASIEASRAGHAGSRFSVIAEEVRKLARNAGDATGDVSRIVQSLQGDMSEIRQSVAAVNENLGSASGAIHSADSTLDRIVGNFKDVDHNISQIASAIEELSITSNDVAQNIAETMNISGDIEQMARKVKDEFNHLVEVAEDLRGSTVGIKTKVTESMILDLARTDHRLFIDKIEACMRGENDLQPEGITDHTQCRFGKWYFSDGQKKCGHLPVFKEIDTPHSLVHKYGREAVALYRSGRLEEARSVYIQAEDQSQEIIGLLEKLKAVYQTEC
jgi:methyl-accepting chemotaxis protein